MVCRALSLLTHETIRLEMDWKLDLWKLRDDLVDEIKNQRKVQGGHRKVEDKQFHIPDDPKKPKKVQQVVNQNSMETVVDGLSSLSSNGSMMASAQRLLNDLDFPDMLVRHSNIAEAHYNTSEWIFSQESSSQNCGFVQWLEHGTGIYWVAGKPGSGKSTLLKYIHENPQTLELLRPWANPLKLVLAKHFFWNSGDHLQKSQEGLLRSLLFDILRTCPDLIPMVCPLPIT